MPIMDSILNRIVNRAKDIDAWRKFHMAFAEWFDAWRIVPRLIVAAYAYMMYEITAWYLELEPKMIEGCDPAVLAEACIAQAPTTQHMAFVTAVVGIAAAIFAFYSNSGRKWNGFTHWNIANKQKEQEVLSPTVEGGRRASDPPSKGKARE